NGKGNKPAPHARYHFSFWRDREIWSLMRTHIPRFKCHPVIIFAFDESEPSRGCHPVKPSPLQPILNK
ncbi:MAG: hypothetical protein KY448_10945, partial [Cyanobacteria bacterium 0813]|nr:hypothetical protein [Cyanobacteria bacterium 0813]